MEFGRKNTINLKVTQIQTWNEEQSRFVKAKLLHVSNFVMTTLIHSLGKRKLERTEKEIQYIKTFTNLHDPVGLNTKCI